MLIAPGSHLPCEWPAYSLCPIVRLEFCAKRRLIAAQQRTNASYCASGQCVRCGAVGLVPLFALALDLPADYFAPAFAEPNCTIRLIHYPPHPSPEDNEFGFAPHTDNNFITFLAQSKLPGLEVRTAEGDWIRPPAVPGTFVVNTGAMLARYSNDRFRATPHRVINRNDRSRYACPFFLGPNHDVVVEPVPSCVGPDNPPKYEPTTYGAFTQHLLTLNFAHRQAGGSGEYAG